ncbi:MAG: GNAT family N-acetyltransferase [Candidatus Kariarchaeaceae archaeon]
MEEIRIITAENFETYAHQIWVFLQHNGTETEYPQWKQQHDTYFSSPNFHYVYLLAMPVAAVVGLISFNYLKPEHPNYEIRKDVARFTLIVDPAHRNQGHGTSLLSSLREFMSLKKLSYMESIVRDPEGMEFARAYGARTSLGQVTFALKTADIAYDELIQGINQIQGRLSEPTQFECFVHHIPEEIIDTYSRVVSDLLNDVPRGSMPVGRVVRTPEMIQEQLREDSDNGRTRLMATLKLGGEIVSLSELILSETSAHQELTGVIQSQRGKRLAQLIKLQMMEYVLSNYPTISEIDTESAPENETMISINSSLGFKKTGEYEVMYIDLNDE